MSKRQHGGSRSRMSLRQRQHMSHWQDSLRAIADSEAAESTAKIDVGKRLREIRTRHGLSIRSLAELSSLNFNTLSLIENEKTSPSVSTLQQLAQALQVPITAFFETPIAQPEVLFQKAGHRPQVSFAHGLIEDMGSGLTYRSQGKPV